MSLTLGILISVWDRVRAVSNCTMGLFWGSYRFFHWLLRGCQGNLVTIRPPKRPMVQFYSTGSLSKHNSDDNENVKIAIGLVWQNNFARTSRFCVHFYAVVARLQRESALFQVLSRTCTQDNNFLFLFLNYDTVLQLPKNLPTYDKLTIASLSGGGCPGCPGASTFGTASP